MYNHPSHRDALTAKAEVNLLLWPSNKVSRSLTNVAGRPTLVTLGTFLPTYFLVTYFLVLTEFGHLLLFNS